MVFKIELRVPGPKFNISFWFYVAPKEQINADSLITMAIFAGSPVLVGISAAGIATLAASAPCPATQAVGGPSEATAKIVADSLVV